MDEYTGAVRYALLGAGSALVSKAARGTLLGVSGHSHLSGGATLDYTSDYGSDYVGGSSIVGFPGQASNPVGYAAAPGWPGSFTTTLNGAQTFSQVGTQANPVIIQFTDVNAGASGTQVTGSWIKFVGCRFQSNQVGFFNVLLQTGSNITFSYCSVTPLASLATAPPNAAWPAASAGQQKTGNGTGFQISGNNGYQYGFHISGGGPYTIDHCDIWGFGNAIDILNTTQQITINACWIHDAADAAAQGYHTDGPGYLNGGAPPPNISVTNCTIASIGNTNGIAFQAASSPYNNITVTGNFMSGFGNLVDMCHAVAGSTNLTFTNNTFGTDLPWVFGPLYANFTVPFTKASNPTNSWSGNLFKVLAGTSTIPGQTFSWTAGDDGKFLWPDSTLHAADFAG